MYRARAGRACPGAISRVQDPGGLFRHVAPRFTSSASATRTRHLRRTTDGDRY